ncbi:MAG: pitrilysin family protein [Pacificimonas sp.]|jgi:predicted Zn-dependent peptidase|nr:pitrilysin family protein [Pacificimonas sp.]
MQRLTVLDNGLRVVTRHMPSVETVAVGLHCDTGSRREAARENGLAHLYEHMVFKGAGGRSARALAETVEDAGGDLNAMTGREGTVFSARLLAGDLDLGLDLIADMIRDPHFDGTELEREKQVILQELAEVNDNPSDLVFDDLQAAAFPAQPLGTSILGTAESLAGLTRDDLIAWRDTHYAPDSLIIVAAGALEHDELAAHAERRFGDLKPAPRPALDPARWTIGRQERRRETEQVHLTLGWQGPGVYDDNLFAARIFAEAVGGGMASRLFQELREERGLAYTVYASHAPFSDTGLFTVYAATAPGDAAETRDLIRSVLTEAAETLDERELSRARALSKSGLLMALESCEGQASYAARQLLVHGRLVEPAEVVEELDALTLDEVRAAGAALIAGEPAEARIGAI